MRRMLTLVLAAVAVATVAPAGRAEPWVGEQRGLWARTWVAGADSSRYRVDIELTLSSVGPTTIRDLRVDFSRCERSRCVEIGHHLKRLNQGEASIADDFAHGRVDTAFAGHRLVVTWGHDPTVGGPVIGTGGVTVYGGPGPPSFAILRQWRDDVKAYVSLGVFACRSTEAEGASTLGADLAGEESREVRTPVPAHLPTGLQRARCTSAPPEQAS